MADPQITAALDQLRKIKEHPPSERDAKESGKKEQKALVEELKTEKLQAEIHSLRQDISERKCYASKTFTLICLWLLGVFILLLLQGFFGQIPSSYVFASGAEIKIKFSLADNVLMAIVGGTTASVIGIFVYVVKYLFHKH